MISLKDKRDCCGCAACAQRCPRQCIKMLGDEEGFLYPHVDTSLCIDCGLCERVCPHLNKHESRMPLSIETAINPDAHIREESSSGGIFSLLAESTIRHGGIVFGARFNSLWEVEHGYTETQVGLASFRGSKYVQSRIGDSYSRVETFLKTGKEVLFSGTPCQITGLRLFLQKGYDNLLCVAIACHSVPSPLVWREYLSGLGLRGIQSINFRDKSLGWEKYGLCILYDNGRKYFQRNDRNPFMQLFLHGFSTRPSCSNCPAKDGRCEADLFLGDCWGVTQMLPSLPNDHQGISFVLCQTEKGRRAAQTVGATGAALSLNQVVAFNGGLTNNPVSPSLRPWFWADFQTKKNKIQVIRQFAKPYLPGLAHRIKSLLHR